MNHSDFRFSSRARLTLSVLAAGAVLGLFAACSSDNAAPTSPIITTGGSGGSTAGSGAVAGSNSGGSSANGGSEPQGGSSNGGSAGSADSSAAGDAGESSGGTSGNGGSGPACPTSDEGFYNQPSTSQKSPFDNTARLGAHATLPPLPG